MGLLSGFANLLMFNRFVSSTELWVKVIYDKSRLKSLMLIRKRSGPNTDRWGTPKIIVNTFKLKSFIIANCLRLVKYISKHFFDNALSP